MPNRRHEMSATQTVEVECPCCQEWTRCCVESGLYDGVVTPCVNACHLTSDFPQDELEARAITAALTERHEYDHHTASDAFDRWDDR